MQRKKQVRKSRTPAKNTFSWSKENIEIAVHAVENGATEKEAAKQHKVPQTTLPESLAACTYVKLAPVMPFKEAYGEVCQQLMNEYPRIVVSDANFCGPLSKLCKGRH